jgi:Fe-S cluster assembly iron-binding protein IscA
MLHVSENAAAALENLRASEGIPETYGVRLSGAEESDGNIVINLAFVEQADDADQVTEQSGTEVYVAPEVAAPLSTAVMDVQASDDGLQLVFRSKAPGI